MTRQVGASVLRCALLALLLGVCSVGTAAVAGEADVLAVEVTRASDDTYGFSVTVQHADSGWEHYADRWEVLGPGGEILATRVLAHPHVEEQPFVRSLSGVTLPAGLAAVTLRAHDSEHGYGGAEVTVALP